MGKTAEGRRQYSIESYRAMIAKLAWTAWQYLPPQTKAWISPDDMISDGIWFVYYSALNPNVPGHYKKDSGVKLGTFLYRVLVNFYREYYSLHHYGTYKRGDKKTIAFSVLQEQFNQEGEAVELETALAMAGARLDFMSVDAYLYCDVVDGVAKMHHQASQLLQEELVRWFLTPTATKFHLHGKRFVQAKKEFRKLAVDQGIDIHGCRHLIHSPVCLDKLSRELRGVPFDLSNPTPGIRGWDSVWS